MNKALNSGENFKGIQKTSVININNISINILKKSKLTQKFLDKQNIKI